MCLFKKIILSIFVIFFLGTNEIKADDKVLYLLEQGSKIIFIRHGIAPGNGDPDNFNLNDCSTQRNLNNDGINQSIKIGNFFKKNKIPIDLVVSSEWCRCKDTAFYAFKSFITFKGLNSFYDPKFKKNEKSQIRELKKLIQNWESDKNLILITHFVVISSLLNTSSSSGEVIVVNKNLQIQGRMEFF